MSRNKKESVATFISGKRKILLDGSIKLKGYANLKRSTKIKMTVLLLLISLTLFGVYILYSCSYGSSNIIASILFAVCLLSVQVFNFFHIFSRRTVVFDATRKHVLINQKGPLVRNLVRTIPKKGIHGVCLNEPELALKLSSENLYLMSIGRYWDNNNLVSEIEKLMQSW
jgi:hypothetical protein